MRLLIAITLFFAATCAQAGYAVEDGRILRDGEPITLRGINWFGFGSQAHVVHGLWARKWRDMLDQMQALGFNAVRLPFCPATLRGVATDSINYNVNPDLEGENSLQMLDRIMAALNRRGMHILMDHHSPDCERISPLWYTKKYSEADWIADLAFVARRYRHLPYFMGIDLKNEPHGKATWGMGRPSTDWNRAAERAAAAVLQVAPDALIFVAGVQNNPECGGDYPASWGGSLAPLACTPLAIPRDRLVLSPHVYGPPKHPLSYHRDRAFPKNLPAVWQQQFGRFIDAGYAVVIGEFGGGYRELNDERAWQWQDALVDYLNGKGIDSAFYWCWNANGWDTGGILKPGWDEVAYQKLALLKRLWGDGLDADMGPASGLP